MPLVAKSCGLSLREFGLRFANSVSVPEFSTSPNSPPTAGLGVGGKCGCPNIREQFELNLPKFR